jgi:hypothetical protein
MGVASTGNPFSPFDGNILPTSGRGTYNPLQANYRWGYAQDYDHYTNQLGGGLPGVVPSFYSQNASNWYFSNYGTYLPTIGSTQSGPNMAAAGFGSGWSILVPENTWAVNQFIVSGFNVQPIPGDPNGSSSINASGYAWKGAAAYTNYYLDRLTGGTWFFTFGLAAHQSGTTWTGSISYAAQQGSTLVTLCTLTPASTFTPGTSVTFDSITAFGNSNPFSIVCTLSVLLDQSTAAWAIYDAGDVLLNAGTGTGVGQAWTQAVGGYPGATAFVGGDAGFTYTGATDYYFLAGMTISGHM